MFRSFRTGAASAISSIASRSIVFSFRFWRKRVFKMAPIHHHFELEAWSETKIMLRFWIVAAACGAIGFTLYQVSRPAKARPAHTVIQNQPTALRSHGGFKPPA